LKFLIPLPMPRPISGKRFAPKIRMMIRRMMMSSGRPSLPSMVKPFADKGRGNSTTVALAAALFLLGWRAIPAAQFASGVNLVEVYAAVVDQSGNPVTGLRRADFTVLEDGTPQALSAFAEGDFPLAVALGLDRSFSMTKLLATEASAARTFLGDLRPQDQSTLVAIGSEVETLAPLSTDRPAQMRALDALKPWGTTGLHDAIVAAIDAIQSAKGRRALVLLSDGNDRYSSATANEALDRARASDVMIYPVAIGGARPELFPRLAALTGGRSFQTREPAQLNAIAHQIAGELHHQYLLGYSPSRPIVAGANEWRSITVRVNRPDVTVRARDGYVAK
jgi:Ca-activated chloride channel family protein